VKKKHTVEISIRQGISRLLIAEHQQQKKDYPAGAE